MSKATERLMDALDRAIDAALAEGASIDEVMTEFELKLMALKEQAADDE